MFNGIYQGLFECQADAEDFLVLIVVLTKLILDDFLNITRFREIAGNDELDGSILMTRSHDAPSTTSHGTKWINPPSNGQAILGAMSHAKTSEPNRPEHTDYWQKGHASHLIGTN